jgi:hypothetical protein
VVIGGEAGLTQLAGLLWSEHAQRGADLHVQGSNPAHHVQHALPLPFSHLQGFPIFSFSLDNVGLSGLDNVTTMLLKATDYHALTSSTAMTTMWLSSLLLPFTSEHQVLASSLPQPIFMCQRGRKSFCFCHKYPNLCADIVQK